MATQGAFKQMQKANFKQSDVLSAIHSSSPIETDSVFAPLFTKNFPATISVIARFQI
jgi:hypothetical protein